MRRQRHAKIVATLGPASSTPEIIRALFEAGADVFRLNFSHGSHEEHRRATTSSARIEQETGRPIAVLADLQGPKLRIGTLADGPIALDAGERVHLDLDPTPGTRRARAAAASGGLRRAERRACSCCIDDGKMRLEVRGARRRLRPTRGSSPAARCRTARA